jgi:transposase-like protein
MDAPTTRLQTPTTLQAAIEFFSDADRCHAYMVQNRWPDGNVTCPTCNRSDVRFLAKQRRFECKGKHPRRQFSVKVGTIFEDSPIALKSWLLATWQISNCKNGISSCELARALGVTQKTAWFMNHRIRLAMQDKTAGSGQFGADGAGVEVDETYIGGKARNMRPRKKQALGMRRGGSFAGKTIVMGLLERKTEKRASRIRTTIVPNVRKHLLYEQVTKHVEDGANVYTDALMSYRNLGVYYQHQVIDHAEKYVDGQIHTNGLENYWSLLKRAIGGTYVSVEPFHLFRYLDEQAFRFNERAGNDADRFARTLGAVVGKRVTYDALIGRPNDL